MSAIGQRMSTTQRACMNEIKFESNPLILNVLKVETVEFVGEFITHNFPCVTMTMSILNSKGVLWRKL
jgi:hypothetical protein